MCQLQCSTRNAGHVPFPLVERYLSTHLKFLWTARCRVTYLLSPRRRTSKSIWKKIRYSFIRRWKGRLVEVVVTCPPTKKDRDKGTVLVLCIQDWKSQREKCGYSMLCMHDMTDTQENCVCHSKEIRLNSRTLRYDTIIQLIILLIRGLYCY